VDILDHTNLWVSGDSVAPPPPPPPPPSAAHSPGDWRTANPRLRRLLLRGILPEELELIDAQEMDRLLRFLDDVDDLPV
jgi:hypothetical protein